MKSLCKSWLPEILVCFETIHFNSPLGMKIWLTGSWLVHSCKVKNEAVVCRCLKLLHILTIGTKPLIVQRNTCFLYQWLLMDPPMSVHRAP